MCNHPNPPPRSTYFNWRQDTGNDLQLFVLLNLVLILAGGVAKGVLLEGSPPEDTGRFWRQIYGVLAVILGQDLPDEAADVTQQVLSLYLQGLGFLFIGGVQESPSGVMRQTLKRQMRPWSRHYNPIPAIRKLVSKRPLSHSVSNSNLFPTDFANRSLNFNVFSALQIFSVCIAGLGLISFALVLALVEQVVLEVLEENVEKGSQVFEKDHVSFSKPKFFQ